MEAHIAIFLTPGMGHLIPLVELARKLLQLHSLTVTLIIPDDGSPNKPHETLLQTLPDHVNSIFLPPPDMEGLQSFPAYIVRPIIGSLPAIRKVLSDLKESSRLSAFVADLFGTFAFDVVQELGIPSYLFYPSTAMVLYFSLYLPQLDKSWTCEYRDLPEPLMLPGLVPVHGSDFIEPTQDRKSQAYKGCVDMCKKYTLAKGILVNSFLDLEPDTFKALEQAGSCTWPPVYPVGPLIRTTDDSSNKAECLKWLDKQPVGSVLFVSFGSEGTLSKEQLVELALGLQTSDQRFLLVVRSPLDDVRNATFLTGSKNKLMDPCEYLSADFMERTKEKGFVLAQWAPQVEILSHAAVGGFLTHCGWNSTMESMVHGVPLIAWPLYAEQKMNAVLLSEGLKVAFRVRENEKGVVECEQISRLARRLIQGEEGKELRKRMTSFKDAAAKALGQDGSSTKSLANVVEKWIKSGITNA